MKNKLIVLALASIVSTALFSQKIKENKVPAAVNAAFLKSHISAKNVKWDKENKDYEVSFTEAGENLSILYNIKGVVLESEKDIDINALPEAIKAAMKGKKIKEAAIITKNGSTFYEAEAGGKDYFFNKDGSVFSNK